VTAHFQDIFSEVSFPFTPPNHFSLSNLSSFSLTLLRPPLPNIQMTFACTYYYIRYYKFHHTTSTTSIPAVESFAARRSSTFPPGFSPLPPFPDLYGRIRAFSPPLSRPSLSLQSPLPGRHHCQREQGEGEEEEATFARSPFGTRSSNEIYDPY